MSFSLPFGSHNPRARLAANPPTQAALGGFLSVLIWFPPPHFGGNTQELTLFFSVTSYVWIAPSKHEGRLCAAGAAGVLANDAGNPFSLPLLGTITDVLPNSDLNLLPVQIICSWFCNIKIRSCRYLLTAFCSISAVKKLNPSLNKWAQGLPSTSTLLVLLSCQKSCTVLWIPSWPLHNQHMPWSMGTNAVIRSHTSYVASCCLLKYLPKDFWKGRSQSNQPLPAVSLSCVSLVLIQYTLLLKKPQASPKLFLSWQSHMCSHLLVSQEELLTLI